MHLFVLVVVPHEGRYLVVEERDGTFYLPAGRVEVGENLMAAAVRETIEEAGALIGLRGFLGFDHSPGKMRFVFVGYLGVLQALKRTVDHHSRGARWATKSEIAQLPLRHGEVLTWIDRYETAKSLMPCAAYEPIALAMPHLADA